MSLKLHPLPTLHYLTPTQTLRKKYPLDQGDLNPVIPASPTLTSWYWLKGQASEMAPEPVGGGTLTRGGVAGCECLSPTQAGGLALRPCSSLHPSLAERVPHGHLDEDPVGSLIFSGGQGGP